MANRNIYVVLKNLYKIVANLLSVTLVNLVLKNPSRNYLNQVTEVNVTSNETNQQCVFLGTHQEEHNVTFVMYSCHEEIPEKFKPRNWSLK